MASASAPTTPETGPPHEHFDVLIVGAGLSGIGVACRLQTELPGKSFAVLEAREGIGGTWDLFRYPGIRSDSDMYTLSYPFRPWDSDQSIADGGSILRYIRKTASEYALDRKIRFQHRVTAAEWSSDRQRWRVEVERSDTGEELSFTCSFLCACTGYYRYDRGYTPEFPGIERFRGEVIHPQFWPDGADYEGKRVVVIGSGATAVTLVPALAGKASHVTMLQRSPSYVLSIPGEDPIAGRARRWLRRDRAHSLLRWKNALLMILLYQCSRRLPAIVTKLLRWQLTRLLPDRFDIDAHFKPSYNPWEQRMCFVRDGDLFDAVASGKASIVTDQIESMTEQGIRLASGRELKADVIVTATGLTAQLLGISLTVHGAAIDPARTVIYRGCMLSGLPNLAFTFGYFNASWTLRCDLTARYVCRLLAYMDARGYAVCTPRDPGPSVSRLPFTDFSSSYVLRAIDELPKQGKQPPWRLSQNYLLDLLALKTRPIDEPEIEFSARGRAGTQTSPPAAPDLVAAA